MTVDNDIIIYEVFENEKVVAVKKKKYGKKNKTVIDTITGAATPSKNGTTATTVSTAKSDAPIQIETITLTTWGETEQDAYVPENSIS